MANVSGNDGAAGIGLGGDPSDTAPEQFDPVTLWLSLGATDSLTAGSYSSKNTYSSTNSHGTNNQNYSDGKVYTTVHVGKEGTEDQKLVKIESDTETYTGKLAFAVLDGLAGKKLVDATSSSVIVDEHSFTYAASGATITATCGNAVCSLANNPTLTVYAPTGDLAYDGSAKADGVRGDTDVLPTPEISYTKQNGPRFSGIPKDAGKYTASISLGEGTGKVTTKVDYNRVGRSRLRDARQFRDVVGRSGRIRVERKRVRGRHQRVRAVLPPVRHATRRGGRKERRKH